MPHPMLSNVLFIVLSIAFFWEHRGGVYSIALIATVVKRRRMILKIGSPMYLKDMFKERSQQRLGEK